MQQQAKSWESGEKPLNAKIKAVGIGSVHHRMVNYYVFKKIMTGIFPVPKWN